jgi:23S rRNA pseudouridine2605 synthase
MVARRLSEKPRAVLNRPALFILRREIEPPDACERDRRRAHGTGLQRHVEIATREALLLGGSACLADDQHLGMGARIAQLARPVARLRQNIALRADKNCSHRNFTTRGGGPRLCERDVHWCGRLARHLRFCEFARHLNAQVARASRFGQVATSVNLAQTPMRIAKAMAQAGLCSRREAERWIEAGRVSVNGTVLSTPAVTVSDTDKILVDGKPLPVQGKVRLWRYHKPKGLISTHSDPKGRRTVFEALPKDLPRVVSIGRLDVATEGLLLLTNSGGLARHLELPATGWLRRYRVRAKGRVTQDKLDALKRGVEIDGVKYGPVEARLDREQGANSWLTVGLREGKNREVKRIASHLGLEVNRLIRLSFGPFSLGDLKPGLLEEVKQAVLADQLGPEIAAHFGLKVPGKTPAKVRPKKPPMRKRGRT